jgi:hypothetical protein
LTYLVQTLGRAETIVGVPLVDELSDALVIMIEALRLNVWTESPVPMGTFIIVNTRPFECRDKILDSALNLAGLVRIFDPENELSTVVPGEKEVVESSTESTDVKEPCGTRCKTYSDGRGHECEQ